MEELHGELGFLVNLDPAHIEQLVECGEVLPNRMGSATYGGDVWLACEFIIDGTPYILTWLASEYGSCAAPISYDYEWFEAKDRGSLDRLTANYGGEIHDNWTWGEEAGTW